MLSRVADPLRFLVGVFEHAPVGLAVWKVSGEALLTNPAFFAIFRAEPPPGYNLLEDELLARNGMLPLFRRAFRGETVQVPTFWHDQREHRLRVEEGRRVAVSMTLFPLLDDHGEIEYVAATYRDDTEAALATERLRLAEERHRLAEQIARIGSFEWNVHTGVNEWTAQLEAIHGLQTGEFGATQPSWEELVHPEDRAHARECVARALATSSPVEGEWRVVWPDGSVRWIVGRFQALTDESGEHQRLIGVNIDITERKGEEEARRRAEDKLRITLDSIGDGVIATDADGRVTRMNPVAERLTGWPSVEAIGRPLVEVFRIVDEGTRREVESPVARVLREGTVVGLANHTLLLSRDGSERAIADTGAPIRDDGGALWGVVLVFHDQTQQRTAEREVRDAAARLRVLAETSRTFAMTTDLPALFELVVERVSAVLGETCAIHLLDEQREYLQTMAVHHPDPQKVAVAREVLGNRPLRVGEAFSGKVVLSGKPLLLPVIPAGLRAELAAGPGYTSVMELLEVSSALAVPLRSRGAIIGVLSMLRGRGGEPYSLDDQRLAEDLADRAVLAIENARLVGALEQNVDALARSEARLRRLDDSGLLGIITVDTRGNILAANPAFLEMVGYAADEVLSGKVGWSDMTPPEWRPLDDRAIEQLLATGVARPWEKEYIRKDGTRVPVLVGVAMLDRSGESIAFILDLRERKRAEAAMRESEARKAAVMEAALDAILLMDHEGRIVELNAAAERTFGYAREDIVGRQLADVVVPPSLRERHQAGLTRYLATGEQSILGRRVEVAALRSDGAEFPAEVAVVRIQCEGPAMFTGYIRDITTRRQAAEAELLRRAKDAAEEANAELEAFSYSVAHDLRAPLRSVGGFASALSEDYGDKLDAQAKDYLERIVSGAQRMGELIDALLGLARLTRTEPRREWVDVTAAAASIIAQLRAAEPGRVVDVVVAPGLVAHADPQLLRVVLENLLGNAWKFTNKTSAARIELGADQASEASAFFVRDNGAGFETKHVGKLFAPFRRLHGADEFEGTGVGLATVHRIVRRHGGSISAEGAVDAGATFRVTLPWRSPPPGGRRP